MSKSLSHPLTVLAAAVVLTACQDGPIAVADSTLAVAGSALSVGGDDEGEDLVCIGGAVQPTLILYTMAYTDG